MTEKKSYQVLARKYRPQSFGDVIGQDHIIRIFTNAIELERFSQAYLLTGSRGIGKTTIARIIAKSINCEERHKEKNKNPGKVVSAEPCLGCPSCLAIAGQDSTSVNNDIVEIDGASNTGIDNILELQKDLMYVPPAPRFKIVIIDEVHMLSKSAFNSLLKTLEEPPERVLFIFATTEPHKVLPTIISRCQRFDLKRLSIEQIILKLKEIISKENIEKEKIIIEDEALFEIAKKADGGMRDALSLMDQVISYGLDNITAEEVRKILGLVRTEIFDTFMEAILHRNSLQIVNLFHQETESGIDTSEFFDSFLGYIGNFLLIKLGDTPSNLTKNQMENIQKLTPHFTEDEIIYIINYLIETKNNFRTSTSKQLLAELALVKLARISDMKSLKSILENMMTGSKFIPSEPQTPKPINIPNSNSTPPKPIVTNNPEPIVSKPPTNTPPIDIIQPIVSIPIEPIPAEQAPIENTLSQNPTSNDTSELLSFKDITRSSPANS